MFIVLEGKVCCKTAFIPQYPTIELLGLLAYIVIIVLLVHDTVVDDEDTERADVVIAIQELDDVLMKDVGDKIAASGK